MQTRSFRPAPGRPSSCFGPLREDGLSCRVIASRFRWFASGTRPRGTRAASFSTGQPVNRCTELSRTARHPQKTGERYGSHQARRDSRPPLANARPRCTASVYLETERSAGIGIDRRLNELVRNCVIRRVLPTGKICRNLLSNDAIAVPAITLGTMRLKQRASVEEVQSWQSDKRNRLPLQLRPSRCIPYHEFEQVARIGCCWRSSSQ